MSQQNIFDIRDSLPHHETKRPTVRDWTAIPLKERLIVLHTTDWDTSIDTLVKYDIGPNHISQTGCPGITYHDIIMKDGRLYHCESYKHVAWHAGKWNTKSVAIALMYRCSNSGKPDLSPTKEQVLMLQRTLVSMCLGLKVRPQEIKGHRELESTGFIWKLSKDGKAEKSLLKTCPGMSIDLYALRRSITLKLQTRLKLDGFYSGEIDGDFGQRSTAALLEWRQK